MPRRRSASRGALAAYDARPRIVACLRAAAVDGLRAAEASSADCLRLLAVRTGQLHWGTRPSVLRRMLGEVCGLGARRRRLGVLRAMDPGTTDISCNVLPPR